MTIDRHNQEGIMEKRTSKWATIKRGDGKITGYIELFYAKHMDKWVSIPGVSRWRNA